MPNLKIIMLEDVPEDIRQSSQNALNQRKWARKHRADHPEKRNAERRHYYDRRRLDTRNARQPWMLHEIKQIMDPDRPSDRKLSEKLGRSLDAIQVMRWKCKDEE